MNKNSLGICIVSSYSPRKCGIATYTSSLKQNILKLLLTQISKLWLSMILKKYHYSKRVIATISQEKRNIHKSSKCNK